MSAPVSGVVFALCAAIAACPRVAHAQDTQAPPAPSAEPLPGSPSPPPPDALPTLDESTPVLVPDAPPAASVPTIRLVTRAPEARATLPIRARRRLALLGEVGWNGIAGFGPNLVFNVHPHLALDLGAGLSFLGWKTGARARVNLLTGHVTPFVGIGGMVAGGLGDSPIPINDNHDGSSSSTPTVNIKVLPSAWAQTVAGVDWTTEHGFTLLGTVGYAFLLSHDPVEITSGTPTADEKEAFDALFRSGLVITAAVGYAFR